MCQGREQNKIADCKIFHMESTGKNINLTGKRQGKDREFNFEKAVGTMFGVINLECTCLR